MPSKMRKHRYAFYSGEIVHRETEEHFCERCGAADAAYGDRRGWWCGWNGQDAVCKTDPVATAPKLL